jgi:PAS domain S-box-containing protein
VSQHLVKVAWVTLRRKTLTIFGLSIAVLLILAWGLSELCLMSKYQSVEEAELKSDVTLLRKTISYIASEMDRNLPTWSAWDDTYQFIQNHNAAYIISNFAEGSLVDTNYDLMAYWDTKGQLVFGQTIDPATKEVHTLRKSAQQAIQTMLQATMPKNEQDKSRGLVMVDHNPLLFVVQPILRTGHHGPVRGAIVAGIYLKNKQSDIQKVASFSVKKMIPFEQFSSQEKIVFSRLLNSYRITRNQHTLLGDAVFEDIYKNPIMVISIEKPRETFLQGRESQHFFLLCFSALGVALLGLLYSMLDKMVLKRVSGLHRGLSDITLGRQRRLPATKEDTPNEIAELTSAINQMLGSLEESESQLSSIMHNVPGVVYRAQCLPEKPFELQWISDGVKGLTGYDNHGLNKLTWGFDSLISSADKAERHAILRESVDKNTSYELKYPLTDRRGNVKWVHERGRPVRLPESKNILLDGIIQDITELKKAQSDAEAATVAKSMFLANMSHEIRTPLNGIIGMCEILESSTVTPTQIDAIETIQYSSETLLDIVDSILDLSKIEAGKLDLEAIPFNLHQMIHRLGMMMQARVQKKGLEFRIQMAKEVPEMVIGDPTKIRQIILNLLSNSVKFTSKGYIALGVDYYDCGPDTQVFSFYVTDTGIGIPIDKQADIFEKFTQSDASTTRKYGGTGLGLAICKQLTTLMGGEIGVISEPDRGARFWVIVPLQATPNTNGSITYPSTSSKTSIEQTLHDTSQWQNTRILLVEDNTTNQKVCTLLLNKIGVQYITIANNGIEALKQLDSSTKSIANPSFDVIIMDCQMPEMDGLEATRLIRQRSDHYQHIPVIALTANAHAEDKARCLESGMTAYLSKPCRLDTLRRCLEATLQIPNTQERQSSAM